MDPEYSERSYILDSERYIGEPPKFYSSFMPAPAALVFRMHEIIVTNLKYMIPHNLNLILLFFAALHYVIL